MRNKVYKSNRNDLLAMGRALLDGNDDALFGFRITLVNMVLAGGNVAEIAANGGMDSRSLQRWVKSVDDAGSFEGLRPRHPTGRPAKLNAAQKEDLKVVISHDPLDFGYQVWEGKTVSSYIYKTYGVELKVRACQNLLHELGFSVIRPQPHPNHQPDQEPREAFKKN